MILPEENPYREHNFLSPGESFPETQTALGWVIYAKGNIQENSEEEVFPVKGYKNYQLLIRYKNKEKGEVEEFSLDQIPFLSSWTRWYSLKAVGDLDGDGKMDVLLGFCGGEGCNCYSMALYLSSRMESGQKTQETISYGGCGC